MLNPIARNLIALCVTLSLTACIASTNPVGPESAAVSEPNLMGTWRYAGTLDDVWTYVHVLPLPDNRLQIVAVNELRGDWAVLAGHISAAGPRRVLSLKLVSASEAIRSDAEKKGRPDYPYSFVVYRLEGKNRLLVAQPFKALTGALQKGKLQGESPDNGIFIADEPERIAAALASATDPDLFTQTAVYLRVEAP
jgi:hypothetical protein